MPEKDTLTAFDALMLSTVSILGERVTVEAIREGVAATRLQTTTHQMIYIALRRLRQAGLIQAVADSPLRYTITDAGRFALAGGLIDEDEK